jgi:hypothetical protein
MKKTPLFIITLLIFCSFTGYRVTRKDVPAKVQVRNENGKYVLYRNDEPYFIKGAGGYKYYDRLKECGGNSVRLWSTEGAREYLDRAHELGLTVTLGLDLGHERRGFNYSDPKAVRAQFEKVKKEVLKYKDHPALLMWGVGNEVDQFAKNFKVWDALNDIMKFIHEVDPNHPTTTMMAGVPVNHIRQIVKRCPHLDILSINAFKWIEPVRKDITAAGWTGPYMIGEWGASGYWESPNVPWGTFLEETSTQKAEACAERYKIGILQNTDRCLGSYVFLWGWKQARTHTLLSLFNQEGQENGIVDVLHQCWKGTERPNKAPLIVPVGIDDLATHKGAFLKPSSEHFAYTDAKDPDGDEVYYYWEIYPESREKKEGGDLEATIQPLEGLVLDGLRTRALKFKAPAKEGPYRLFVTVYDGKNHIATANAPFYVKK